MAEYVNASELAYMTKKSRQWICRLCREGRIPAQKVGKDWLIDAMVDLPIDPRGEQRAERLARREKLAKQRKLKDMALYVGEEKPVTWRDWSRERLEEEYDSRQLRVIDAILKGWHIDGKGTAWVRARDNEPGQVVNGVRIKNVGQFDKWDEEIARFFKSHDGITSVEGLVFAEDIPVAPAEPKPESKAVLDVQLEIDAWVDKGAEIDDNGEVTIMGAVVGRIVPWGELERNWYKVSKNSV